MIWGKQWCSVCILSVLVCVLTVSGVTDMQKFRGSEDLRCWFICSFVAPNAIRSLQYKTFMLDPLARLERMGGSQEDHARAGDMADGLGDGFDVLNYINFQWDMVSPSEMSGRFVVKPKTSQPFGVLHGGITAFLAETLASFGAQIVSQWARVAGIDLTVSHLQSAPVGSEVTAKAVPLRVGKRVQVWDVNFTIPKAKGSSSNGAQEFTTIAVARLSVIVGLPDPERGRVGNEKLIAIAKKMNIDLVPHVRSKL